MERDKHGALAGYMPGQARPGPAFTMPLCENKIAGPVPKPSEITLMVSLLPRP